MPPSASIPLALLFALVFYLVLGAHWYMPFTAGFLSGYLAYDMIHYHVHHHKPRTRVGRKLRELHMRHHFQDHERGFGVSAPYWDHVFGTPPERRGQLMALATALSQVGNLFGFLLGGVLAAWWTVAGNFALAAAVYAVVLVAAMWFETTYRPAPAKAGPHPLAEPEAP